MLYEREQWCADIDSVVTVIPEIRELSGKNILITGAAGLICSAVVDVLFRYNDKADAGIKILAAGRSFDRMRARFGEMVDSVDFEFVYYDATHPFIAARDHADYIIHGAGNSFPALVMKEPVETMFGNVVGMKTVLDYARATESKRVLYISSSEVYGRKENENPYGEDEYGYIDLLNPRNSYSVSKRAAETLCVSYAAEYGVDSVIVRPGHVYGPTASSRDSRVSSAWVYDAARGRDIVMKSDGSQKRSYCYCLDCASAIIKVLLLGQSLHAYNISNPSSIISIKEMAELLTKLSGTRLKLELPTDSEKRGFTPMKNSSLESDSLAGLGWRGCFDAETGFEHTLRLTRDELNVTEGSHFHFLR
ncbi:MAG: NAD-dependent epimerase/dehydratase family protein [Synergistaceae bacterium]|nr:NAD-dependent epimerase/dehydratase family protein [Synergistaceae bacterium]